MSDGMNRHLRRLADRRYQRMRIYERTLLRIRQSPTATARELRDMARRGLEEASR
jgi:hypothetical protein